MSSRPDHRRQRLARMKAIALGCLLLSIALLIAAHLNARAGIWAWVGAFAEAATIGALADWFAVVALFRHPLGLPIPHTAIIPRKKARLADALGDFLLNNFLSREQLLARLDAWNPALQLGRFMDTPARVEALARQMQHWLADALKALDSAAFEQELISVLQQQLRSWDASHGAARLMRLLSEGGHHQRVLNAALREVSDWLDKPAVRAFISEKLVEMARREYPKLIRLADAFNYTEELGVKLAEKLAVALMDEMQTVLNTPEHPLRQRYAEQTAQLLQRLEDDAAFRARVDAWKNEWLQSPELGDYSCQLWQRLWQWLHRDLASPDSRCMDYLRQQAARLGARLRQDALWQQTVNAQIRIAAEHLAGQIRELAPAYIRQTVNAWDSEKMSREIELSVGRDLQYIRLNGTLIGGLAGLALHGLLRLL
ncbi:DUF445 domain-containing protein [Lysobacteraceae bacterium NML120232]|nr:DUF445 domain-containing protein [Xanthomonadaceae bacterium NML120232]